MSKVDETTNFWIVRLRDPELFSQIRTADWSSHAATEMTKRWLLWKETSYQRPEDVPESLIERFPDFGETHARRGKLRGGQEWLTQSVLIPKDLIDKSLARPLACYISGRLDRERATTC